MTEQGGIRREILANSHRRGQGEERDSSQGWQEDQDTACGLLKQNDPLEFLQEGEPRCHMSTTEK